MEIISDNIGELKLRGSVHRTFSCEWTIENFSSFDWHVGNFLVSPEFQLDKEGIKWCFGISCEKGTEHSRVCVFHIGVPSGSIKNEDINLSCNVCMRNTDGEILCQNLPAHLSDEIYVTYPGIVEMEYLISKLINDTLVMTVELTYSTVCYSNGGGVQCYKEFAPTLKMAEDFKNLWTSKENTDCVISVGEQHIPCHSLILGARSKVFAATFRHDTLEKSTHRVEMTDFKKDTVDCFLEFIYSGSVLRMDYDLALELLRASEKYEVGDLKSYCSNYLMSILNNANVCQVLVCADIHNAGKLRSEATKYICENLHSTEDFVAKLSVLQAKSGLLFDIVKEFIEQKRDEEIKPDGQGNGDSKRRRYD